MLRVTDLFRLTTIYVDCNNQEIHVPSLIYDSVGTNKFVNLLINIINAILEGRILFIDVFESTLHYLVTRSLLNIMNIDYKNKAQFILATHGVILLILLYLVKIKFTLYSRRNRG